MVLPDAAKKHHGGEKVVTTYAGLICLSANALTKLTVGGILLPVRVNVDL